MHRIFHTRSTFFDLEHFLRQCSSTLDGFEVVCSTRAAGFIIGPVISNLDAISHLLQGALVPCTAMGFPRHLGEFRYPNPGDPLSVGEIEHQAARAKLMEKQQRELEQQQQREQQQQQQREREQREQQKEAEDALLAYVTPATKQQRPAKTTVKPTLMKPTATATAIAIRSAVAATLAGLKSKKNLEPNAGGKKTNKNKQQRSRRRRLLRRQQGHVYRTSRRKSRRRRTQ